MPRYRVAQRGSVAGLTSDIAPAMEVAAEAIDSGRARETLDTLCPVSNAG